MVATPGIFKTFAIGFNQTGAAVTAGTVITVYVPPHRSKKTKLTKVVWTCGTTAHNVTAMTPLGKTTISSAVAAAAATFTLASDPGDYSSKSVADNPIAANDYYAVRKPDGTLFVDKASAVTLNADGTVTVTPTAAVPTLGFAAGATVWFFGIITDTNPKTGQVHQVFRGTASSTNTLGDGVSAVVETAYVDEPVLLHNPNGTAQGSIDLVTGGYGL